MFDVLGEEESRKKGGSCSFGCQKTRGEKSSEPII